MSQSHHSFLVALTKFSKDQIQQAGENYTPGQKPGAPNLQIKLLYTAMENIACGEGAHSRFQSVLDEFSQAWKLAKYFSQRAHSIQDQVDQLSSFLLPMLCRLRDREARAGEEWLAHISSIESSLIADKDHWSADEAKLTLDSMSTGSSSQEYEVRGKINAIGSCLTILQNEKEYIESSAFKVLFDPFLLVRGEWGTGKTHSVCDFTQKRLDQGQPTVLVLAKKFQGNIVEDIRSQIEPASTIQEVFNRLEELTRETKERTLIILDGVNEGDRNDWQTTIAEIQKLLSDRPNIGLIATCRTPAESIAQHQNDFENFHQITHLGFVDQEFEAQAAFFKYYQLPLSEVPLLDREFSRPRTLNLICQSLQKLSNERFKHRFSGIASGQKGMTYILESFVNSIGKSIELQFGLQPKDCWKLLKGNNKISDESVAGFAPCMGQSGRDYVLRSEVDSIIAANYPNFDLAERKKLLEILRTNGLIDEVAFPTVTKTGLEFQIVFRLPYPRISDHLIVRHLLKKYLKVTSCDAIRQSFEGSSPLARIFRVSNDHYQQYANPGWAAALIAEFPERVKNRLKREKRELFFILPKRAQSLDAYFDPFIKGLFWREPCAFSEGTRMVVNHYLCVESQARERMIDALVAVSTKPNHPYHARCLYDYLARHTLTDRDLKWSEYLRLSDESPTIRRLLTWAERFDAVKLTEQSASALVVLLSLVLTTVVRRDRDLVTKVLVLIGERFPGLLFSHVQTTLGFNDPYVPERMLAAAYGTTMSLVDSEAAPTFRPLLGEIACTLHQKMFGPNATNTTHHTLMRDYALGIIEIAERASCFKLPEEERHFLAAPFSNTLSTFLSDGTSDPSVKEKIKGAISKKFEDDTIRDLISTLAFYDETQLTYAQVLAKIERRVYDLGYRTEQFGLVDAALFNTSWRAHDHDKVDPYGQKYSWIAFFEMLGEVEANNKRPDWRPEKRTPKCDIDPSFPKCTPSWNPPVPDLFGDSTNATEAWVKGSFTPNWHPLLVIPQINEHNGEWILLDGCIFGTDEIYGRELESCLRGLFIKRKDKSELQERFLTVNDPGNAQIPRGWSDTYLYAGEAGHRQNYARHLYQRNGKYKRQIKKAFDRCGFDASIPIEIPYIGYGWESHHSPYNDFLGFKLPAPSLIQRLQLVSKNREVDFYDSHGSFGTLYRVAGNEWNEDSHRLLYIRADLLRRYLKDTRQILVWCNWGKRNWLRQADSHLVNRNPARLRIYQDCAHIHRSFLSWSTKEGTIV